MRKLFVLLLACVLVTVSASSGFSAVALDEVNFPDETFRNYLSNNFDADGDKILSNREILNIKEIDVGDYVRNNNGRGGGYVLIRA